LIKLIKNYHIASFAGIVLGLAVLLVPGSAFAADFVGSDECQECHEENYRDWSASGHPYKLMKGEQAKFRPIPLPLGISWDDISYVIGGYKWKSRYMDKDGYIITVTGDGDMFNPQPVDGKNQYNYLTGEWVDYHAGEENLPYTCGSCHTTNWVADEDADTDNDLSDNQDGLPGIHGTFSIGGVHCEQCHGNGLGFPGSGSMEVDKSAEACGICHFREAGPDAEVNVIPASGGFIKHHEQYNEFLASPHSNMNCVTCHDPHKRGEFSIKPQGECTSCHLSETTSFMSNSMAGYGVECIDCHMPYATKSANQLGPFEGDVQTHLFYINTDDQASMFTPAGDYVSLDFDVPGKPSRVNKGAVTLDFACKRCHETAEMTELGRFAKNFHGRDTSVPELEYIGINAGLTGNWWGGPSREGEGFLLEVANSDGNLTLLGSFYTYDTTGNQLWLVAVGAANTGMTTDVTFYINKGQKWGNDFDPNAVDQEVFGTGTFTFTYCDAGHVAIVPNQKYMDAGYTSIDYVLQRDITEYQIACPNFNNAAN